MGRLHLFELEDQSWCPKVIREGITDYLLAIYKKFNVYQPAYQKIHDLLAITKIDTIIDCCSGSSGPITQLLDYLNANNQKIKIQLTDKYPNLKLFQQLEAHYPEQIKGCQQSIDASKLPVEMKGLRTFFSAFHHFNPEKGKQILQDAVNQGAPIAIFESTQRHPADFLRTLISPILTLFIIPKAKRLTWLKSFLTYVVPIIPFAVMWDYFVSNLRTYSIKEMQTLINQINAPYYRWEVGKLWCKPGKCYVPYLIGYPDHKV